MWLSYVEDSPSRSKPRSSGPRINIRVFWDIVPEPHGELLAPIRVHGQASKPSLIWSHTETDLNTILIRAQLQISGCCAEKNISAHVTTPLRSEPCRLDSDLPSQFCFRLSFLSILSPPRSGQNHIGRMFSVADPQARTDGIQHPLCFD